eukprot:TRINITY_DN1062_c0_g1_i5.p2 TRINITY_DN1062_c0_g1~~TRINITY_DN1062_c0_g1_i5.p2  ORF type:complete len:176 (+),score=0.21 TRINITY_DN1062_c0_g1_i5:1666-2193(+)
MCQDTDVDLERERPTLRCRSSRPRSCIISSWASAGAVARAVPSASWFRPRTPRSDCWSTASGSALTPGAASSDPVVGLLEEPRIPAEWHNNTSVPSASYLASWQPATPARLPTFAVWVRSTTGIQMAGTLWPAKDERVAGQFRRVHNMLSDITFDAPDLNKLKPCRCLEPQGGRS